MRNESGLEPLGWAVLVEPFDTGVKSSLIAIPESVQASTAVVDQQVKVVAIGRAAWSDEKEPRARPGDVVLVTKYAGHLAPGIDGKLYRLVNAKDIFCRVKDQ